MAPFAKALEDTRCAFRHSLTAMASCVAGELAALIGIHHLPFAMMRERLL
jgi:hypothetical protein